MLRMRRCEDKGVAKCDTLGGRQKALPRFRALPTRMPQGQVSDSEVFFAGKDVARALGYSNTRDALNKHVDDEDKLESRIATSGQNRKVIFINESGLYSG